MMVGVEYSRNDEEAGDRYTFCLRSGFIMRLVVGTLLDFSVDSEYNLYNRFK